MSRLIKKFLGPDSVDGTKIKLLNNEALKAGNAAGTANVEILKVNASDIPEFLVLPLLTADPSGQNDAVRKKYVDDSISALINGAPELLNTLKELADALGSDADWATSVASQIAGVKSRLDTLEGDSSVAGSVAKAAADALAAAKTYADDIETDLDGRLDPLEADVTTLKGDASVAGSVAKAAADALAAAKTYADDIETALDGRIDTLEGDATIEGSVAKAEADAKAYADDIETALDDRLDTLEGADTVVGSVAKAQKDAQDFATALDDAMDGRVSALESFGFIKEKKTLGMMEAMQGYVDLGYEAKPYSTFVFVQGGLYLYEGDDYTLSNVGGVTRLSFAGDFGGMGATPLADGDVLLVQYQYQSAGGGGGGGGNSGGQPTLDLMMAAQDNNNYTVYWNVTNPGTTYVAVVVDGPGWTLVGGAGLASAGYGQINKDLLTNGSSYRLKLYTDMYLMTPVDPQVISAQSFTASISSGGGPTAINSQLPPYGIMGPNANILWSTSNASSYPFAALFEVTGMVPFQSFTKVQQLNYASAGFGIVALSALDPAKSYVAGLQALESDLTPSYTTGSFQVAEGTGGAPPPPAYNLSGTGVTQNEFSTISDYGFLTLIKRAEDRTAPNYCQTTSTNVQFTILNTIGAPGNGGSAEIQSGPSDADLSAWITSGTVPAGMQEYFRNGTGQALHEQGGAASWLIASNTNAQWYEGDVVKLRSIYSGYMIVKIVNVTN